MPTEEVNLMLTRDDVHSVVVDKADADHEVRLHLHKDGLVRAAWYRDHITSEWHVAGRLVVAPWSYALRDFVKAHEQRFATEAYIAAIRGGIRNHSADLDTDNELIRNNFAQLA